MAEPKNVIFKIQADTAQLRRELESVKKSIDGVNTGVNDTAKNISGLGSVLKGAAAAFGGITIGSAILDFGKNAIQAASDFQTLQISFTQFLGSSEKAKTVLADLQNFSAATPFTGEEVQNAGRALLAFGEQNKNLIPVLERIGDISAGTGKNFNELALIYGKARAANFIQGDELNQLAEAGIPIYEAFAAVLKTSGDNIKKLGADGQITFKDLEKAVQLLTQKNNGLSVSYAGLTEQLGQSFAGRVSTLKDNLDKVARSVGTGLLPIFETVIDGASRAIAFLSRIPAIVEKNKTTFALLGTAVSIYAYAQTRSYIIEQLKNKESLISIIRQKGLTSAMLVGINVQRVRMAAQVQGNLVQRAYAVGTEIATIAQEGFNIALKQNPLGLLITGLTLALTFMVDYGDATEDAAKAQADANKETETFIDLKQAQANIQQDANASMATEISKLDQLFKQLKLTNAGSNERKTIIEQINSTYGTTLKNLGDEAKFVKQVDEAYKKLTNQIKLKALAEATTQQLTGLFKQALELQNKLGGLGQEGAFATQKAVFEGVKQSVVNQFATDTEITKAIDAFYLLLSDKQKSSFDLLSKENQKQIATFSYTTTPTTGENVQTENAAKKRTQEATVAANQLKTTLDSIDLISKSSLDLQQQLSKSTFDVSQVGAVDDSTKNKTLDFFNDLKRQLIDLENEGKRLKLEFNVEPLNFQQTVDQLKAVQIEQERIIDLETERAKTDAQKNGTLTPQNKSLIEQIGIQKKLNFATKTGNDIAVETYKEQLRIQKLREDITQTDFEANQFIQEQAITDLEEKRSEIETKFQNARTKKAREALKKELEETTRLQIAAENKASNDRIAEIERKRKRDITNAKGDVNEIELINKNSDLAILKEKNNTSQKTLKLSEGLSEAEINLEKEKREKIKQGIEDVRKATIDFINQVIEARIREADAAISAQEKRIEQAKSIAEKGNAEVLQLEQERLDKLTKERAKFVRAQQALAFIELALNSSIAIAKAAAVGGPAAAFTITATLLALAAGFISARSQAQAAAGFERGGYTGDGGKSETAGVVHKGEFVFTKEKTTKYRSMFEAIHKGRNPELALGVGEKIIVVNNGNMDEKLSRIETAIREQSRMNLSIDERGIHGLVSHYQFKENRIRSKAK